MRRRIILTIVFLGMAGLGVSLLSEVLVYRLIQKSVKVKTTGFFEPSLWNPSFSLKNARFDWQNKVKFLSGDLKVRYDLLDLLIKRKLRVQISSQNATIHFQGSWAKLHADEKIPLQQLFADVVLDSGGLKEIYVVEARSPSFQFSIKQTS